MFQNKNIKRLKNEITEKIPLKQKKYAKFSYYKEFENGKITFSFYKKVIGLTLYFNDELPYDTHDNIFKIGIENQSQIHPKCKCGALGYDFIEFDFFKDVLNDLTCNDLITASENLIKFYNNNITKYLVKPDYK